MPKKEAKGIDAAQIVADVESGSKSLAPLQTRTEQELTFAVNRLISGIDIAIEDLQRGADELLALSVERLKKVIIETYDDEVRIKAINTAISLSNNIVKRRHLQLEEGGAITVNISPAHVPGRIGEQAKDE